MRPGFFGDSYDFVKRDIIGGLAPVNEWAVHPMYFDDEPEPEFPAIFAHFLGLDLVDGNLFDRNLVATLAESCQNHVFLDPDTGLKMARPDGRLRAPAGGWGKHVSEREISEIVNAPERRAKLTLVFDQSFPNANPVARRAMAEEKLQRLWENHRIHGVSYLTHVVFTWLSDNQDTLTNATRRFIQHSGTPTWRLTSHNPPMDNMLQQQT